MIDCFYRVFGLFIEDLYMKKIAVLYCFIALVLSSCNGKGDTTGTKNNVVTHLSDVAINKGDINTKYNAGAWLDKDGMFSFDTSTGMTGSASFITDNGEVYFDLVSDQKQLGDKVEKQFISSVLLDGAINNTIFKTEGVCPKGWKEEYDQQQVLSTSADGAIKIVGIICQDPANPNNEMLYSYFLNNGVLGKLDIDNTPVANCPIFYQGISNNGKYMIYDNLAVDDESRGEDTIFDLDAKKSVSLHNPDGTRFALSSGVLSLADNASVLAYRFDDVKKQDEGFTFMLCSAVNGSCKDIIHSEGSYYDSTMSDNGQFIYLVTETNKVKKLLVLDENAKVIKDSPFDINQFKAKYGFDLTVYNSGVLKIDYMDETSENRVSKFYSYSSNKMVSLADVAKALHLTRKAETDNMLNMNIDISSNGKYALVLFSETDDPYYNGTPLVAMNRVFVANGIDSLISAIGITTTINKNQ